MKKFILLVIAFISMVEVVGAAPKGSREVDIRVGSYNVWSHSARNHQIRRKNAPESRNWDSSKQAVAELIVKIDCDILGMQEVTSVCRDDLAELIKKAGGKKYKLWWENTYPEGSRRVVGNTVLFNKKVFKLSKKQMFYFSPTPTEISKGWDEKRYYRAAMVSIAKHKPSGKKFFFIATHGPLGKVANGHAGRILVEIDQAYNHDRLPVIVVGDMNARPGETFHKNMCAHYEDAYLVAEQKCGTIGTFNGARGSEKLLATSTRRIDHIYIRSTEKGKIGVKNYLVNRDKAQIGGVEQYPSDHNPVIVDLKVK